MRRTITVARTLGLGLSLLLFGCGGGPTEPDPTDRILAEGQFTHLVSEAAPAFAVPLAVPERGTLGIRVTWTTPGPTRVVYLVVLGTCPADGLNGCGEPVVESSETDGDTTASTTTPGLLHGELHARRGGAGRRGDHRVGHLPGDAHSVAMTAALGVGSGDPARASSWRRA